MSDLWNNGYLADSCMHDIPLQNGCDGCEETNAFMYRERRSLLRMKAEIQEMAKGDTPANIQPIYDGPISQAMYKALFGDSK